MSAANRSPWRSEVMERLRQHLGNGLSGSQCAAALCEEFKHPFSRNGVIGKVLRAGLRFMSPCSPWGRLQRAEQRGVDGNRKRPTKYDKPPMERRSRPTPEAVELTTLPPDQSPYAVSLIDARDDQCRWPLNDAGPDFRFCGAPCVDPTIVGRRSRFCPGHHRIAYRPYQPMTTRRLKLASRPFRASRERESGNGQKVRV